MLQSTDVPMYNVELVISNQNELGAERGVVGCREGKVIEKLFLIVFFETSWVFENFKNFLLLKFYGKMLGESLKRKNKINLYMFFAPSRGVPYHWYKVYILTRSYEKTSSNFGDYVTKWDVDSSSRISSTLTTLLK